MALLRKLFGGEDPKPDTHDNQGVDYHMSWYMNADGSRSTTWASCRCDKAGPGGDHDGAPVPK